MSSSKREGSIIDSRIESSLESKKFLIYSHQKVRQQLSALLDSDKAPHSMIFVGADGIGKKLVALEWARERTGDTGAIDLTQPASRSQGIYSISPEGSQIKIEQIRDLLAFLSLSREGKPFVIIFNDAHLLTAQAANALLKTVEEPPPGVTSIFLTPSVALILPTLRSRSHLVRFQQLNEEELRQALSQAGFPNPPTWVIGLAGGSMSRALELLQTEGAAESLRPAVDQFLESCSPAAKDMSARVSAVTSLKDKLKDKESQELAVRLLSQRIHQAWRLRSGSQQQNFTNLPQKLSWLVDSPYEILDEMTELASEVEADLKRNVDRQLLWESLASRVSRLSRSAELEL